MAKRKKKKKKTTRKSKKKTKRKATKKKKKKRTTRKTKRKTKKKAKKKAKKKTKARKTKKKRKANAAFMAPLQPSAALAAVVGKKALPRTQVVKKLWQYIKRKKLQDKKNRRMINNDATLKAIFKKPKINMFEMNKHLKRHLK